MSADKVQYQLGKGYENFTGLLNRVYPVEKGVATIPAKAEEKAGRMLETHYGAKKLVAQPQKQEEKK